MPQYPHKKNVITSRFGYYNPFGTSKMHYAHDYGNNGLPPSSMPTGASITGTVIDAGYDSARGNYVILRGTWSEKSDAITENYHLNSISVKKGQSVYEGETIGYQGNTGSSTAQHTHVGFYLVPKSYVYSKNGIINKRNDYALDPMAFFRKAADQIVDVNGKYTYKPIPKPEPRPNDLTQITNGKFTLLTNVEVFFVPFNQYSPIVGGDNRSKKYLGHFFPNVKTYVAQYVCHTPNVNGGDDIEWAGIITDWGLLWAPVTEGRSTLTYDGKVEPSPAPEPEPSPEVDPIVKENEQLRSENDELKKQNEQLKKDFSDLYSEIVRIKDEVGKAAAILNSII